MNWIKLLRWICFMVNIMISKTLIIRHNLYSIKYFNKFYKHFFDISQNKLNLNSPMDHNDNSHINKRWANSSIFRGKFAERAMKSKVAENGVHSVCPFLIKAGVSPTFWLFQKPDLEMNVRACSNCNFLNLYACHLFDFYHFLLFFGFDHLKAVVEVVSVKGRFCWTGIPAGNRHGFFESGPIESKYIPPPARTEVTHVQGGRVLCRLDKRIKRAVPAFSR